VLVPLVLLAALAYGLPMVLPASPASGSSAAEINVDDPAAVAADVGATFTALAQKLPASDLADVEKLTAMADVEALKKTSLVDPSTVVAFLLTVVKPLSLELYAGDGLSSCMQRLVSGYELLNACGFWLEALGYYAGFIYGYVSAYGLLDGVDLGPSVGLYVGILLELGVALVLAYVLHWMVLHADPPYTLLATCAYVAIGFVNLLYGLFCLFSGFEPLRFAVYILKFAVAAGCAYYARKLQDKAEGGGESPGREDYVVVTKMDERPPPFPGKAVPPQGAAELM